jgi:uncharacterized SAM-binding protein YcdF (DUF218 family)
MLKPLLLPPAVNFLLALIGYLLRQRHPRLARILIITAFATLLLLSLPLTSGLLKQSLEWHPPIPPSQLQNSKAEAIVLLTSGRSGHAPEFGQETTDSFGLERSAYASFLQKQSGLPLLISGGILHGESTSLAAVTSATASSQFGAQVQWLEQKSHNTFENALYSHEILAKEGIRHILLVTHSSHMLRSRLAFEHAGFIVTAAPTRMDNSFAEGFSLRMLLPGAFALYKSTQCLYEYMGIIWYWFRAFMD